MAKSKGGVGATQPSKGPLKIIKDGAGGGSGRLEKVKAYGSKPGKAMGQK